MPDSAANRISWQQYDLTVNRYGGSGGSGYGNGNDFEETPAADNIQAIWPFESVALDIPETKNGQDFTGESFGGATTKSLDTGDYIENAGCMKFSFPFDFNRYWHDINVLVGEVLSDMPGLQSSSNAIATVMFWYKYDPTTPVPAYKTYDDLYNEFLVTIRNLGVFEVSSYWALDGDTSPYPADSGGLVYLDGIPHASSVVKDKWYHYTFWYDGNTGDRKIGIYDPVAQAIVGTNKEFQETPDSLPYPSMGPTNPHVVLGFLSDYSSDYVPGTIACHHRLDELVIAKTWLSDADVLKIRQGAYP